MAKAIAIKFILKLLCGSSKPMAMHRHKLLQPNGEELQFEEASPKKNKLGTIIFTHGLSEKGYKDQLTNKLVNALISVGYQVILPLYSKLCDYDISPTVSEDFRQSLQTLLKHGFSTNNTVALFSVSFSGPYILKVASDPSLADSISSILLLGSPYSYKSVIDNQFSKTTKPNLFVRMILATNLLQTELSKPARMAAKLAISQLANHPSVEDIKNSILRLDHQDRIVLDNMLDGLENGQVRSLLSAAKIHDFDQYLSLSESLNKLQSSVAIIQGEDDEVIPVSEGESLYRDLIKQKVKSCLTINPLISHVHHKFSFKYLAKGNEMLNVFSFYFKSINDRTYQRGKI